MRKLLHKWLKVPECSHCENGFIPYKDLLAVVKRNFPNTFEGLVKTRKGERNND